MLPQVISFPLNDICLPLSVSLLMHMVQAWPNAPWDSGSGLAVGGAVSRPSHLVFAKQSIPAGQSFLSPEGQNVSQLPSAWIHDLPQKWYWRSL